MFQLEHLRQDSDGPPQRAESLLLRLKGNNQAFILNYLLKDNQDSILGTEDMIYP